MTLAHCPGRDPFRMAAWQAPRAMRGWLTDDSSLTARIRARCGRFSLQVVGQGKAGVLPDELAARFVDGRLVVPALDDMAICRLVDRLVAAGAGVYGVRAEPP